MITVEQTTPNVDVATNAFEMALPAPLKSYLMMKISLQQFGKIVSELNMDESNKLVNIMNQTLRLYGAVLVTDEAKSTVVSADKVNDAITELQGRFSNDKDFKKVLKANNLNKKSLTNALMLEIQCEDVLEHVSDSCMPISNEQAQSYYFSNIAKFKQPERRKAHHILITINPDFIENTAENSRRRLDDILSKIDVTTFDHFAQRYSECPTAMNGGDLGLVEQGILHPELNDTLFSMKENTISNIVESEVGLHILWCESIAPAHTVTYSQAKGKIIEQHLLAAKKQKQKTWIASLFQ